jgi:hypothetical protein
LSAGGLFLLRSRLSLEFDLWLFLRLDRESERLLECLLRRLRESERDLWRLSRRSSRLPLERLREDLLSQSTRE